MVQDMAETTQKLMSYLSKIIEENNSKDNSL